MCPALSCRTIYRDSDTRPAPVPNDVFLDSNVPGIALSRPRRRPCDWTKSPCPVSHDVGPEYKQNKRPFDHSSTDHPPVTKGAAPCHHPEILPHSALTIQSFALAGTTCECTPGIRPTGILALPFGYLPLEPGEGFDGVSQTGQPVAPDLPAADLLEPR